MDDPWRSCKNDWWWPCLGRNSDSIDSYQATLCPTIPNQYSCLFWFNISRLTLTVPQQVRWDTFISMTWLWWARTKLIPSSWDTWKVTAAPTVARWPGQEELSRRRTSTPLSRLLPATPTTWVSAAARIVSCWCCSQLMRESPVNSGPTPPVCSEICYSTLILNYLYRILMWLSATKIS